MANSNLFDTKTLTLNEILGNGKIYHVPQFQRDYTWTYDQWEDLWNDLMDIRSSEETHYMGSIVLQTQPNSNEKKFWIIDGQQRLTTLSIVVLAIINKIRTLSELVDREANKERADLLINQYIGQKDASSLLYSSKLFLNENNNSFYQQRLLLFKNPVNPLKLIDSEKLLWKAYNFFVQKVNELFENETKGETLSSFLNNIVGDRLRFIQIIVFDEINAYTVFETLNSRGVELTSTDLLKNYIFSLVAKDTNALQVVKEQWQKTINAIGLKDFPIFLRYFLNSRSSFVSKDRLFKSIKKTLSSDQNVLDLLDQLENYANIYSALSDSEDELWQNDKSVKSDINSLILFDVTLCYPLLMVAFEKFTFSEFKKLLHGIMVISFRYNVIGKLQTNVMETAYNKTAVKVFESTITTATEALKDLNGLYLTDDEFKNYFELKSFNTTNSEQKKIARYILYKLEAQLNAGIKTDYSSDDGTIEHILPENMDEHWCNFFSDKDHNLYVYFLGNLTLLEAKLNNREAGRKSFEEKKEIYHKSKYALSKEVKGNIWNVKTIKDRQSSLAKTASGVWKI